MNHSFLFEELFDGLFKFKHLKNEDVVKLGKMGYNVRQFDDYLNVGKATLEDVKVRTDLYDQFVKKLKELDSELEKRNKKPAPAKRGDVFDTKKWGKLFVIGVGDTEIEAITENGKRLFPLSFEDFKMIINQK